MCRVISGGDNDDLAALNDRVYKELKQLAASYMLNERAEHTLQPTALVHEAFVRLEGSEVDVTKSRAMFFYAAARAMRQVLIDHARYRGRAKRDAVRVELDEWLVAYESRSLDIINLGDALTNLEDSDPYLARIIELRFFAGLSAGEIAGLEEKSERTIQRDLQFAKAWLRKQLDDDGEALAGVIA